ncbi:ABC transporter substrate-binding protein [Streptomyces hainanensis]|uniref:Extracellular solute-binding protein n=1 Tax=Streptomyces hainanensis TaxID=402648 RepID=A0A4R4T5D0_9ACTN|nr:extracellular solute-binding protein [Streptomyces hainanensis]TDC69733.1 extracellular solute-binding protein [Streptomyces hainanensis]
MTSSRKHQWTSARKLAPALLTTGALVLTTAACGGGDSGGGGDDGPVTLRLSWWGNDVRQGLTAEAVALFEESHPDITVEQEYADWDSYYDRLTTQLASGDAPDVFATEIRRMGEFATRGALADMSELVETGDMDPEILTTGQVEGTQYAIPTGANAFVIMANTTLIEEAGLELPDDTTWTWDDYREFSAQVTETVGDGTYGTQLSWNDAYLNIYAAQRGESFYEDDQIGMSAETVADWFEYNNGLVESGATPDASLSAEIGNTSVDQSLISTGQGAFGMWWSNQLNAVTTGSGSEIEILRWPQDSGAVSGGQFLQPTMYWNIAESSGRKDAAAELVDFLINDPEAAAILGSDRGLPINGVVREQIEAELPETDQQSLAFIDELSNELADPPSVNPVGAGEIPDMLQRYGEEVNFGRLSPQEAAEAFIDEANSSLG